MKIYTKTGDLGETGLFGGKRVPKNHVRVEACGTIDEANDFLGLACAHLLHQRALVLEIQHIQGKLFDIGAAVATPGRSDCFRRGHDRRSVRLPPVDCTLSRGSRGHSLRHSCSHRAWAISFLPQKPVILARNFGDCMRLTA